MAQRFQPLQPYKILKEHQSSTSELITWHFTNIFESIHRKLTLPQNFRDSFTVKITTIIFRNLFYQAYRAIRDYPTQFGIICNTNKNRTKKVTGYVVKFTLKDAFQFHLKKLCGDNEDIERNFCKWFQHREKAELIVTEENPALFEYKVSTDTMNISIKYSIKNKYGIQCSI